MNVMWFMEGPFDIEYMNYRVMAFEKSAMESFGSGKLEPFFSDSCNLLHGAECILKTDSLFAYMLANKEQAELFEKMECVDKQSEQWLEFKNALSSFAHVFWNIRRAGGRLLEEAQSKLVYDKIGTGPTKRIFIRAGDEDNSYVVRGERLIENQDMSAYGEEGDLFVYGDTDRYSIEKTIVPVIETNIWRFT